MKFFFISEIFILFVLLGLLRGDSSLVNKNLCCWKD